MKRSILAAFAVLALTLIPCAPAATVVDGVNVVVDDKIITFGEVESSIANEVEAIVRSTPPAQQEQKVQRVREEKINDLVRRQLVLQEFKRAGYNLPESFIDDAIQETIRKKFGDRVTLIKTLQAEGITYESFREQQKEQIIIGAMQRNIANPEKVVISPYKIERYYEENKDRFKMEDQAKVRIIMLKKGENPEAVLKLANEIQAKLKGGASFAEMAMVYSDSYRKEGGNRGWIDRGALVAQLNDAAFSLKPGEHSGVIEMGNECYILKVEEMKPAHIRPLLEVQTDIERALIEQETARLQKKWMDRLEKKSFVRYYN